MSMKGIRMLSLSKHRHGSGSCNLYYIDCTLDDPMSSEHLNRWEIQEVQPHMQVIKTIVNNDIMREKHIVVKLRSKKQTYEHTPQNEFRISEKLNNINGFIRPIGVFENNNETIEDDDINKHILVIPYIQGGSLMEFQMTTETIPILKSLVIQATLSLAEAFIKHGFMHQSLHWCNALYEKTDDTEFFYEIGTEIITIPTHGHKVVITDLSRSVFGDTEPDKFWRLLRRFYDDHWQIFVGYIPRKVWNKYYEIGIHDLEMANTPITKDILLTIIEKIQKSSFCYDTD
jgi:hypothetical protein